MTYRICTIVFSITCLHLFFLFFFFSTPSFHVQKVPKKILVQTLKIEKKKTIEQKPTTQESPKKEVKKIEQKKPEQKKTTPPQKKTTQIKNNKPQNKKPPPKKEPKKNESRKKNVPSHSLKELQEALDALEKTPTKSNTVAKPQKIGVLASEKSSHEKTEALSYEEELTARLQLALTLPEYGEVRVKLTLSRQGKVRSVAILSGKCSKNNSYIASSIKNLSFPSFGDMFLGEQEHAFVITFQNG